MKAKEKVKAKAEKSVRYPLAGRRSTFKTVRCLFDREEVEANRAAIEALFRQYGEAIEAFMHLMPVRAPYRNAFKKRDMASVKAVAPGLRPGLRSTALDKAIEMWRSFEARGGTRPGSRLPLPRSRSRTFTTIRIKKKDYSLHARVVRTDTGSGTGTGTGTLGDLRILIPTPKGDVMLRPMGKDHQVPLLLKVISGEGGLIRCVAELVWKGTRGSARRGPRRRRSGPDTHTRTGMGTGMDMDLFIDVHIARWMERTARDLPMISDPGVTFVPIGVDLGTYKLVTAVARGKGGRGVLFVDGGRWRHKRRSFARRRRLRSALGDDVGRKAACRDEANYIRDMAHKVSRMLIDHALGILDRSGREVPVLVLEDLGFEDMTRSDGRSGGRPLSGKQATMLSGWPFRLLRDLIIEKASWEGVPVMLVPPNGTSIACPRCGGRDAVRRRDVHRLVCPDCGYRANDDHCAATNIARKGLGMLLRDRNAAFGRSAAGPTTARHNHRQGRDRRCKGHVHDHDHTLGGATGPADGGDVDAPQGPVREGCGNTARTFPRGPDARHGHGMVRAGDSTYDLGR